MYWQHIFSYGYNGNTPGERKEFTGANLLQHSGGTTTLWGASWKHCWDQSDQLHLLISCLTDTLADQQLTRNFYWSTDWFSSPTDHPVPDNTFKLTREQHQRQTDCAKSRKTELQCNWQACMRGYGRNTITRGLSWRKWEENRRKDSGGIQKMLTKDVNQINLRNWTDDNMKRQIHNLERR